MAASLADPVGAREGFAEEDAALRNLLGRVVLEVSGGSVYNCVDGITKDFPTMYRPMGTPSHHLFVQKYGKVFEEAGLRTQVVHFEEGGPAPQGVRLPVSGGDNIIGVRPGRDLEKWVVVGAHYDTQLLTQGGAAIDNTSGICVVKEIAESFRDLKLETEATLVFAWWDGEEWGLYGSRAFVKDHNATKELLGLSRDAPVEILAAMSFDIVGINYPAYNLSPTYGDPSAAFEFAILNLWAPPDDAEHFTLCPSYACYRHEKYTEAQLEAFANYQALVREAANGFLKLPEAHVQVKDDTYGRSDHAPFTAAGIPGLRIQGSHDAEFPQYHTPADTLAVAQLVAGGETQLRGGFDRAADVGALVAAFVALKGSVGGYAIPPEDPLESGAGLDAGTSSSTPGPAPLVLLLAAASALAFSGQRRRGEAG